MHPHESTDIETLTKLHASLRLTLDYLCTQASLADLFLLQERLSAQAAQVARQRQGPAALVGIATPRSEIDRLQALQRERNRQQSQAMGQIWPLFDQYRQEG